MSATFDDYELDSEFPQDVVQDPDNEPHVRIPISIIQVFGKQLGATGIAVYVGVKSHANRLRGNSTFILVKTLADELGMGESTVRRELLKCERLKLLTRKHRLGKSTIYFVTPVLHLIEGGLLPNRTLPSIREKYNYKNLTNLPLPTPSASDSPMAGGDGGLHHQVAKLIQGRFEAHNKLKCPWNGSEAKMLSNLIRSNPSWSLSDFQRMVNNRFDSDGINGERPRMWLANLSRWTVSPLDQYGKPKSKPVAEQVNLTGGLAQVMESRRNGSCLEK